MMFRKDNVILNETDKGKQKELEALGYERVSEADLKPKSSTKAKKEDKKGE